MPPTGPKCVSGMEVNPVILTFVLWSGCNALGRNDIGEL